MQRIEPISRAIARSIPRSAFPSATSTPREIHRGGTYRIAPFGEGRGGPPNGREKFSRESPPFTSTLRKHERAGCANSGLFLERGEGQRHALSSQRITFPGRRKVPCSRLLQRTFVHEHCARVTAADGRARAMFRANHPRAWPIPPRGRGLGSTRVIRRGISAIDKSLCNERPREVSSASSRARARVCV